MMSESEFKCSRCGALQEFVPANCEGGGYYASGCGCEMEHEIRMVEVKPNHRKKLIYLAGAYSGTPRESFNNLTRYAVELFNIGFFVYSPITHCHPMAVVGGMPTDFEFWGEYNRAMISKCDEVIVLMYEGWEDSTGVQAEIKIAREIGIPVWFRNCPKYDPFPYNKMEGFGA